LITDLLFRYVQYLEKVLVNNSKKKSNAIDVVETNSSDSIKSNNGDITTENSTPTRIPHHAELSAVNGSSGSIVEMADKRDREEPTSPFATVFEELDDKDVEYPNPHPGLRLRCVTITPAPKIAGILDMEVLNGDFEVM